MSARTHRTTPARPAADAAQPGPAAELLPVLRQADATSGGLKTADLAAAAEQLRLTEARTCGVASFYSMLSLQPRRANVVRVCDSPVCALAGCGAVREALQSAAGEDCSVERSSCLGLCDRAPAVLVNLEACGPLAPQRAAEALAGWRGEAPSYAEPRPGEIRVALKRAGQIDHGSLEGALAAGCYAALGRALDADPRDVLQAVTDSGLQGRGGAGFPTGRKWQMVADAPAGPRYIVCNADESEPAAFKDRVLMEEDPHAVLEGMALAAYAVGAETGVIYVRGEYESAARRLEEATRQAEAGNWLGDDVRGSGFRFQVHVHRGAGAYICGEETAMLESLEGRRGEPRLRPPYPTTRGLYGKPTVVNNVETLCNVPRIVLNGPNWYRGMGTSHSPGTKLFAVTGHVGRPGLFEAPLGITLRQVIDEFAGGMQSGRPFKMALTGGAAGTIVGESALDVPLDFASHGRGASLGAGAILVTDKTVSAPQLLAWLLHFFEVESCGKCTPCRGGTVEARALAERIARGAARAGDVERLRSLSRMLRLTSFCGLGQSVAWPLDSALESFADEF